MNQMTDKHSLVKKFQSEIKSILTPYGFLGSKGEYYKKISTGILMIGWNSHRHEKTDFSLTIGFGLDILYQRYKYPKQAKFKRSSNCHYNNPIGWFNHNLAKFPIEYKIGKRTRVTNDIRWRIGAKYTDQQREQSLKEISYLLKDVVLPFILAWEDIELFRSHIKPDKDTKIEDSYYAWIYHACTTEDYIAPPIIRPA